MRNRPARALFSRYLDDRQAVLTIGTNILVMAFAIGPAILAARALGPRGRGELAAALVWASLLSAGLQLGMPQALTYFAAARRIQAPELFSAALVMALTQTIALAAFVWALLPFVSWLKPELVPSLMFVPLLVPFLLASTYLSAILQGLSLFAAWNTSRAVAASAYPTALLLAVATGTTNVPRVLGLLVAASAIAAVSIFAIFTTVAARPGAVRVQSTRTLLAYGLRAHWGNLAWLANTRLDQFVVSLSLPLAALGHYAVAVSIAGGLMPISAAFASVTFARVPSAPPAVQATIIWSGATRALMLTGVCAAALAAAAPWVIPFVFGSAFAPSVPAAMILLVGAVVLGLNYVLSDALRGLNLPARVALIETLGLVVTSLLLWTLIPRFGITGAALASLGTYVVIAVTLVTQVRRATTPGPIAAPALS